jgi:uncharacterized protein DUF4326
MPEGAIYVGRPTVFGNPFSETNTPRGADIIGMFQTYAEKRLAAKPGWLEPLRGKDLACWCSLSSPCHADVLLRLANEQLTASPSGAQLPDESPAAS